MSVRPSAKGFAIGTSCCGPSFLFRPFSVSGKPIKNFPAGTTIIVGQPS